MKLAVAALSTIPLLIGALWITIGNTELAFANLLVAIYVMLWVKAV